MALNTPWHRHFAASNSTSSPGRDRVPSITSDIHPRLHAYIGGITRNLGAHALMIGGIEDQVHLLLDVPPKLAPADLIRDLKSNSSGWIHETFPNSRSFNWQTGYGAFSVSPTAVPNVMRYIERQEEHHRRVFYADEMRTFLREAGLEFDERWLAGRSVVTATKNPMRAPKTRTPRPLVRPGRVLELPSFTRF